MALIKKVEALFYFSKLLSRLLLRRTHVGSLIVTWPELVTMSQPTEESLGEAGITWIFGALSLPYFPTKFVSAYFWRGQKPSLHFILLYFILFYFTLFCSILFYLFFGCIGSLLLAWAFSSCRERGLLFVVVRRLLIAVASLVVEHRL